MKLFFFFTETCSQGQGFSTQGCTVDFLEAEFIPQRLLIQLVVFVFVIQSSVNHFKEKPEWRYTGLSHRPFSLGWKCHFVNEETGAQRDQTT